LKRLILAAALFASPAFAQQSNPTPTGAEPAQAALGQEVMECMGGKVQLRARLLQLEAELAKAKAPPAEGPPSVPPLRAN
jgi:hypothetical protein